MWSRISKVKVKVKSDRAFESSFNAQHINSGSLMHAFFYSIITQRYNCARKYWNIYFPPCVSFLLCELLKWATLWNSQSEQSSTLSHTVKQPIRAELNIELHCETANQSRAQHWAALWNSQSEQSSTLSRTVKQPIRAELNIEPHCETANQSRAQHYYSWPFQIRQ